MSVGKQAALESYLVSYFTHLEPVTNMHHAVVLGLLQFAGSKVGKNVTQ